jgi:tetratricopeptide (TPR) repeat protein
MKKIVFIKSCICLISLFIMAMAGCQNSSSKLIDESAKAFVAGNIKSAKSYVEQSINANPQDEKSYFRLASISMNTDYDNPEVISANLKKIEIVDTNYIGLLQKSFSFLTAYTWCEGRLMSDKSDAKDKIANEIAMIDDAIKRNPNNPKLFYSRAIWHYLLMQDENAINDLNMAVHIKQDFVQAYLMRCNIYCNLAAYGKDGRKIEYFNRSLYDCKKLKALNYDIKEIIYKLVECISSKMRSVDNENKLFDEAYMADTTITFALENKAGNEEHNTHDYEAACRDYSILYKKHPEKLSFLINMGKLKIKMGSIEEGMKDLKSAIGKTKDREIVESAQRAIERYYKKNEKKNDVSTSRSNSRSEKFQINQSSRNDRRKISRRDGVLDK